MAKIRFGRNWQNEYLTAKAGSGLYRHDFKYCLLSSQVFRALLGIL